MVIVLCSILKRYAALTWSQGYCFFSMKMEIKLIAWNEIPFMVMISGWRTGYIDCITDEFNLHNCNFFTIGASDGYFKPKDIESTALIYHIYIDFKSGCTNMWSTMLSWGSSIYIHYLLFSFIHKIIRSSSIYIVLEGETLGSAIILVLELYHLWFMDELITCLC